MAVVDVEDVAVEVEVYIAAEVEEWDNKDNNKSLLQKAM
jgi:hypothetical protein